MMWQVVLIDDSVIFGTRLSCPAPASASTASIRVRIHPSSHASLLSVDQKNMTSARHSSEAPGPSLAIGGSDQVEDRVLKTCGKASSASAERRWCQHVVARVESRSLCR